jgi:hypothetical protein
MRLLSGLDREELIKLSRGTTGRARGPERKIAKHVAAKRFDFNFALAILGKDYPIVYPG